MQGRKGQNNDNYQRWSRTVTLAETIHYLSPLPIQKMEGNIFARRSEDIIYLLYRLNLQYYPANTQLQAHWPCYGSWGTEQDHA